MISTSNVERANLIKRRPTPPQKCFSKTIESHMRAISLHDVRYNFARIHKPRRVTRATAAGIVSRVRSI